MPDVVTTIATPILTILISTPLALSLIAPLGVNIGNLISNGLLLFSEKTGFIGLGVLAALWEFLVMTGMHLALMMPMLASFFETGQMSGAALCGTFATWAVFGVALGATLRLKGKKEKGASFGFLVSGIVGGITEPTLYGLCFNHKRCFGTMILGAFVGGVLCKYYQRYCIYNDKCKFPFFAWICWWIQDEHYKWSSVLYFIYACSSSIYVSVWF